MDFSITVDLEPTNRCNASCDFCRRDQTPHEGLMTPEVFEQSLARTIELRASQRARLGDGAPHITVSLCGLGEPLLNPRIGDYVAAVREAGFDCVMSSNGAILNEKRANAILDGGLQKILINVGEEGEEYESIYKLPWEKTHDNILRFAEMAEGRCEIDIVLVDHRRDRSHVKRMVERWEARGFTSFLFFHIQNRGGALFVDHMQYEQHPHLEAAKALLAARNGAEPLPICAAPFVFIFIGYDGNYYLCSSDWKKEVPLGNVFERTIESVTGAKLAHVTRREPICKTCNHDPLNRVVEALSAVDDGTSDGSGIDPMIDEMHSTSTAFRAAIAGLGPDGEMPVLPVGPAADPAKKLIPVDVR